MINSEQVGVFVDTNIPINIAAGRIDPMLWMCFCNLIKARNFTYFVSPLTAIELIESIVKGQPSYFSKNKRRVNILLQPGFAQYLEFPRPFAKAILASARLTASAEAEWGLSTCFAMLQWAQHHAELDKSMVLPFMTDTHSLTPYFNRGIGEVDALRATYIAAMNQARAEQRSHEPGRQRDWGERLVGSYTMHVTHQLVTKALRDFDAEYRFERHLFGLLRNRNYSFEERRSDLIDGQQLGYLARNNTYFLTEDKRLMRWIKGSAQVDRVLDLEDFLNKFS